MPVFKGAGAVEVVTVGLASARDRGTVSDQEERTRSFPVTETCVKRGAGLRFTCLDVPFSSAAFPQIAKTR